MADKIIQRAPSAEAALSNRDGIVEPPDGLPSAGDAMDELFKNEFGREPDLLDHTPDRDRDKTQSVEEITTASEIPDADPIDDDGEGDGGADEKEAAEKAVAEKAAADEKAAAEKAAAEEKAGGKTDKPKDFLDDLLGDKEKPKTETPPQDGADPYEAIKLRSDASDKTKDTFAELKRLAKEREQNAKAEAEKIKAEFEAAKKEAEELRAKTASLPDNAAEELKALREFRATFDVERDPEFVKKYDEKISANDEAVYATLRKNGLKEKHIEAVKQMPKEERIDQISAWAEKLTAREKLVITAKLADNENIESQRQAELSEVKAKADKILAEKQEAPTRSRRQFLNEVVENLKPLLPQLPFLAVKDIPDTAPPQEKEALTKHNTEAASLQQLMRGFLEDDTPRTRGLMALASVMAPRYRSELTATKAKLEEAHKEIEKLKSAGRLSRTARSAAPEGKAAPVNLDMSADEALEAAWQSMQG